MTVDVGEQLKGRTVLVAGASRGIGLAVARAFAEAGSWVGMTARSKDVLVSEADAIGGHAIPADVSSAADVHRLATYLLELLGGPPEVLVNSSGAFTLSPLAEMEPDAFDRQIDANLRAPFLLTRAFLPGMLARRDGHIVNIGSVASRIAMPGNAGYSATKFGLRGMHEVLAEEVRGTGVRATLVEPAATDTALWDELDPDSRDDLPSRGSMLRPEAVASAVLFAVAQPPGVEIQALSLRAT
jgi:NAD(P)-dependent dehydrogenase (short-subunit alcohol dehydrogenase family)